MARTRPRPASRNGASPQIRSAVSQPTRKIFNCIVDDSALVAGVKKSTRNGIRQWVKNGQIRLFVPLHALEELSSQKVGKSRHADDVRETLAWLDEATSKYPNTVTLQGADETFDEWAQVQKFAVPRTLFSEYDHDHDLHNQEDDFDDLAAEIPAKLTLGDGDIKMDVSSDASEASRSLSLASIDSARSSVSAMSPPSSPVKHTLSPAQGLASAAASPERSDSLNSTMPLRLQPLLNYIMWRVHQETDLAAALASFIFLCNDNYKVSFAKGFDIKTKRLEQLREAVGREDREFKNRQNLLEREINDNTELKSSSSGSEDDEVVYKQMPTKAPAAMQSKQPSNVIDPNTFGRIPQTMVSQDHVASPPKSPRGGAHGSRGSPRGSHASPFMPRGTSRGNARGAFRGAVRGRGNFATGRGGFVVSNTLEAENTAPVGQIDPDSFARPESRAGFGSVRGGRGRKLWVPT